MTIESSRVNTGVFWNIEDCPIPDGLDPCKIFETIKSSLADEGYHGDVSVWAYSDKSSVVDEFFSDYNRARIKLRSRVPEEIAKLDEMVVDILLYGVDNPAPANVMVISKEIAEDTDLFDILQKLKSANYNILVVQPEEVESEVLLRIISSVWLWQSQPDGDIESGVMPDSELMLDSED